MKAKEEPQSNSQESETPWQFYLVIGVIVLSVLVIVLRAVGIF
jgi:hypothetical protein